MGYTMLVYCRNSVRLLGLLLFMLGLGLSLYQVGSLLWMGTAPDWTLQGIVPVPQWLHHAPPLVQGLCGWPWVVIEFVPLPLGCLVSGLVATRL